MSVVVGCSLFDGVLLLADVRGTVLRRGRGPVYVDNVQKLLPLTRWAAIGFVGDITTAACILQKMTTQVRTFRTTRRQHTVALLTWIPRFLRAEYQSLGINAKSVTFMVGSVIPDRLNIIERAKAAALLDRFRLQNLSHQRNWLPRVLLDVLRSPPEATHVALAGVPANLLYVLASPRFEPELIQPLESRAIGSGQSTAVELDRQGDMVFAGEVGNDAMEAMALTKAVEDHLQDAKLDTVGGLLPCIKVCGRGVLLLGSRAEIPIGGEKIELFASSSGRWVQRHLNSGKEIPLQLPWEINFHQCHKSNRFDHLSEAVRQLRKGK